jgi:predicted nuclease with TOPRIM domain
MTNQDRNYLSMLSDSELVRTALDRNHELAIVLAERLSELLDVQEELDEVKNELDEVNKRLDHWQAEANMLQASLDRIDAE